MPALGYPLSAILIALAVLHAYWGFGGHWPGSDDASLVDRVVGRTKGMKAPSAVSCFLVALALAAAAALVWLHLGALAPAGAAGGIAGAYWLAAAVFLLRGLATYFSPLWRYAEGTRFHRLNRRFYGPMCLLIAAGFIAAHSGGGAV